MRPSIDAYAIIVTAVGCYWGQLVFLQKQALAREPSRNGEVSGRLQQGAHDQRRIPQAQGNWICLQGAWLTDACIHKRSAQVLLATGVYISRSARAICVRMRSWMILVSKTNITLGGG